jgi:hypothetical protein
VRTSSGELLDVPEDWVLVPPGDPALTRRIKQDGPTWSVSEQRGRKKFSRGVWAPGQRVAVLRRELEHERANPAYERKLEAGRKRRAEQEVEYAGEFAEAILTFLAFAPRHAKLAERVAIAVAAHAVPVGSGTVARTRRIPIEQRAEAATIAWLRHQTTAYDSMNIPRVAGMRREVRRQLAQRSRELLAKYRRGEVIEVGQCLLDRALAAAIEQDDLL